MEGNKKMYAQEALGVMMSDRKCIFDDEWLGALSARPHRLLDDPKGCYITTMIDPAGSGESFTAICSVVRMPHSADVIIVGMAEADPQNEIETKEMIDVYMENMLADTILSKLDHIICVENNYGGPISANVYWRMCQANNPRMWEYRSGDVSGVVTTHNNQTHAAMSAQFDMSQNAIHLYDPFVSLSRMTDDLREVKIEFLDQCSRLRFRGKLDMVPEMICSYATCLQHITPSSSPQRLNPVVSTSNTNVE